MPGTDLTASRPTYNYRQLLRSARLFEDTLVHWLRAVGAAVVASLATLPYVFNWIPPVGLSPTSNTPAYHVIWILIAALSLFTMGSAIQAEMRARAEVRRWIANGNPHDEALRLAKAGLADIESTIAALEAKRRTTKRNGK